MSLAKARFPLNTLIKISWYFAITFTILIFLMTWLEQGDFKTPFVTRVIDFALFLIINFNSIFIVRFLYNKNLSGVKLAVTAFFLVALSGSLIIVLNDILVNHMVQVNFIKQGNRPKLADIRFFLYAYLKSVLLSYVIVSWHLFVLSQNEKTEAELENEALKTANSQAIHRLLLQQLHPHFLFNALTTIKSLIHKQPEIASDYVVKLSGFLRASMSSIENNTATLAKELSFCQDYLDLQKVRLGSALYFTINVNERLKEETYLPVFSLQALAENALKHNLYSESIPMHIEISESEGIITVKNDYRPNHDKEYSMGSGLQNLSARFESCYGEKINVHHNHSGFYVSLKLNTK